MNLTRHPTMKKIYCDMDGVLVDFVKREYELLQVKQLQIGLKVVS